MQKQVRKNSIMILLTFTMVLVGIKVKAQQVPLYNQYFNSGSLAYPSSVVFQDKRLISLIYRDQFGGLIGSPKNFALAYQSSTKDKVGFSGNLTTADIGFTSQVKFSGGMGYKLFGKGGDGLSLGTQLGVSVFSLNEDRVNPENPVDNVLLDILGQSGSSFSLDLSASYRKGKLAIDATVPNLVNESLSDDAFVQINDDNIPDFMGGASYALTLNPELEFIPYLGVRYRETIGAELDIMGELKIKEKFKASLGYRDNYGPTVGIGVQVFEKLLFTYNYDFGQRDVPFLNDGFNEFGLHYELNTPKDKEKVCIEEGKAVIDGIIEERIFDENLVKAEDKEKAICYLKSLEEGKRKEVNVQAEEAYQVLFAKIKNEEMAQQEALRLKALQAEQAKQDALKAKEREAERARQREIREAEMKELAKLERQREIRIKEVLSLATESIDFNSGSAILKEESYESLEAVAKLLVENDEMSLSLIGHTDNTGNEQANIALSQQRAESVKLFLEEQGVASDRLLAEGKGSSEPRADNETQAGRAANRRVELKILK